MLFFNSLVVFFFQLNENFIFEYCLMHWLVKQWSICPRFFLNKYVSNYSARVSCFQLVNCKMVHWQRVYFHNTHLIQNNNIIRFFKILELEKTIELYCNSNARLPYYENYISYIVYSDTLITLTDIKGIWKPFDEVKHDCSNITTDHHQSFKQDLPAESKHVGILDVESL